MTEMDGGDTPPRVLLDCNSEDNPTPSHLHPIAMFRPKDALIANGRERLGTNDDIFPSPPDHPRF